MFIDRLVRRQVGTSRFGSLESWSNYLLNQSRLSRNGEMDA